MKLKRNSGEWFYVSFQYERLPPFCFYCGIIGHSDRLCEKLYDAPVEKVTYGPKVRANPRKSVATGGSRWLLHGCSAMGGSDFGGEVDSMILDQANPFSHGKLVVTGINLGEKCGMRDLRQESGVSEVLQGKMVQSDSLGIDSVEYSDGVVILENKRRRQEVPVEIQSTWLEIVVSLNVSNQSLPKNEEFMGFGLPAHQKQ